MVFRRDSKVDAFQRQISALRQQLGGEQDDYALEPIERPSSPPRDAPLLRDLPDLDARRAEPVIPLRELDRETTYLSPEPLAPAIPASDAHTSIIAHTTSWNGTLESSGSLHIHGRVEGALTARNDVFIAEEAEVDAAVSAANVTIAGNVRGSVQCSGRFEVLPRGRFAGDVRAPVLVVHDGAMIAGGISMTAINESRTTVPLPSPRAARGGD